MGVNPKWFYNLLDPIEGEASETPTSPYENKRKFPSEEYTSANILRFDSQPISTMLMMPPVQDDAVSLRVCARNRSGRDSGTVPVLSLLV